MPEKPYKVDKIEQFTTFDREFNPIKNFRFFATTKKGNFFTIEVTEAALEGVEARIEARAKLLDSF